MSNNERPNIGYSPEEEAADAAETADASLMTEGVGGMPDLEPTERATVSDVDGDHVETDRPKPAV